MATVTAAYMNIPVAHIQSGDLSGHIDGSARHAITKLAHFICRPAKTRPNGYAKWERSLGAFE
ncbi:MAG: UDP-N-acetylglucosamine 2-epimerase [Nitrospira sp.]|nr:UDP-N-acetylglucosamine 2-epimerase [Nitrospira sp.]